MERRAVAGVKEFWFEVQDRGSGRWLWVETAFAPPRRGERDPCGVPLEPDEPAELFIVRVEDRAGAEVPYGAAMESDFLRTARALLGF